MRFWPPFALSCIAAAGRPRSPADTGSRIDTYIATELQAEHIPGLQLGIYDHGKVVKAQGYASPTSS